MYYPSENPVFSHKNYKRIHLGKYQDYTQNLHVMFPYFQLFIPVLTRVNYQIKLRYFLIPAIKHKYGISMVTHMLAILKVWGSILIWGRCFFKYILRIYTSFFPEITCLKQEFKTRGVHEKTESLSLSGVLYTCFSFIELVFWTLATRDIVCWETIYNN